MFISFEKRLRKNASLYLASVRCTCLDSQQPQTSSQPQQHHPSCASFRLQSQQQQPNHQQHSSSSTAVKLNSFTKLQNGGTCRNSSSSGNNRSKTPVLSSSALIAAPTVTCDDFCRLETRQFPTKEATLQLQQHRSSGTCDYLALASQPVVISLESKLSSTVAALGLVEADKDDHQTTICSSLACIDSTSADTFEHCDELFVSEQNHRNSHLQCEQAQNNDHQGTMQSRRASCLTGSQPSLTTLSAFVNGANNHQFSSGHQHSSCHSPSHQMLLCTSANGMTPSHPVAHQHMQPRCLLNEAADPSLSSINSNHKSRTNFGHSSTLPPNSTLSSLLASAKSNDQQRAMYQQQQQALRRQTSLNQLDTVVDAKPSGSSNNKNESKPGSFQQRIKAILSPQKDSSKTNSTLCQAKVFNGDSTNDMKPKCQSQNLAKDSKGCVSTGVKVVCDVHSSGANNHNHRNNSNAASNNNNNNSIFNNNNNSALTDRPKMDRPLSTLNKYTISASSSNLASQPPQHSSYASDNFDEEDSYNLRNVCNKLFAQKQYSCLQSSSPPSSSQQMSDNMMTSVQKSSASLLTEQKGKRNMTPDISIEKVTSKENIYSAYNRGCNSNQLTDIFNTNEIPITSSSNEICQRESVESVKLLQPYDDSNLNHKNKTSENGLADHVVVVSNLNAKNMACNNGLTVRTQNGRVDSSKIIHNANQQGSTLSLNGVELTESSVASQDHNYKSSSESGRGTMNSHVEDRSSNNIDLNSPADLTSLDSDQSNHQMETSWKEKNTGCVRRCNEPVIKNNYSKIQRYLDDQRCPMSKETDLTLCKEFKSKLSLNDESESWTSVSDDPSIQNPSSKSKSKQSTSKILSNKHRYQTEPKLKTNFSKPENCLSQNSKQTLSIAPVSQAVKSKIMPNTLTVSENKEAKTPNGMLYDKCIYSVPNKGKFRNIPQYGNVSCDNKFCDPSFNKLDCDNGSITSDPESNFPDDGCSEFTDYFANNRQDPLRKQLRGIEDMYSELLNMLNTKNEQKPRKKLFRRNSGRSSVASRTTRDYIPRRYRSDPRKSRTDDNVQMSRRYKKLESQVLTLAKSVSQLSADIQFNYMLNEEMESLRHEVEMVKSQMSNLKQTLSSLNKSHQQQHQQLQQQAAVQQHQVTATLNARKETKKVDRIKRLFVDEPQPMKQFLKKLGYEKYLKQFEAEKIGLAELNHLNEDRLQKLGIPMGPRIRILQEAKNLNLMLCGKQPQQQSQQKWSATSGSASLQQQQQQQQSHQVQHHQQHSPNLADNFNIYAVV